MLCQEFCFCEILLFSGQEGFFKVPWCYLQDVCSSLNERNITLLYLRFTLVWIWEIGGVSRDERSLCWDENLPWDQRRKCHRWILLLDQLSGIFFPHGEVSHLRCCFLLLEKMKVKSKDTEILGRRGESAIAQSQSSHLRDFLWPKICIF